MSSGSSAIMLKKARTAARLGHSAAEEREVDVPLELRVVIRSSTGSCINVKRCRHSARKMPVAVPVVPCPRGREMLRRCPRGALIVGGLHRYPDVKRAQANIRQGG